VPLQLCSPLPEFCSLPLAGPYSYSLSLPPSKSLLWLLSPVHW
jgi:hypothetical protein